MVNCHVCDCCSSILMIDYCIEPSKLIVFLLPFFFYLSSATYDLPASIIFLVFSYFSISSGLTFDSLIIFCCVTKLALSKMIYFSKAIFRLLYISFASYNSFLSALIELVSSTTGRDVLVTSRCVLFSSKNRLCGFLRLEYTGVGDSLSVLS